MTDTKKTLSTSEVAKTLKIDSKKLRKILRSQASKANGGARYEFKESDLPKLREMIAAEK
jgi:phage antirepressor YoqD-like protein